MSIRQTITTMSYHLNWTHSLGAVVRCRNIRNIIRNVGYTKVRTLPEINIHAHIRDVGSRVKQSICKCVRVRGNFQNQNQLCANSEIQSCVTDYKLWMLFLELMCCSYVDWQRQLAVAGCRFGVAFIATSIMLYVAIYLSRHDKWINFDSLPEMRRQQPAMVRDDKQQWYPGAIFTNRNIYIYM